MESEGKIARVLVCGGRDYSDWRHLTGSLDALFLARGWVEPVHRMPAVVIIHGGAPGADCLADQYAHVNWCQMLEFKANWQRYGRAAGPIRNKRMLEEGKPDIVVAFPGRTGTANMVMLARAAKVEVVEIKARPAPDQSGQPSGSAPV
jgi:hypothetical protein